eukprot:CAMPEP_0206425056 /NCGR_PEP_ID=MMETSP0324_2-20121206/3579_1 /ASSEMBLY_ACC=CAM_ASM_000836 /TAXON_ID=2866 /ORGANISM="Crypthecodinium cohnii, Strain Seligo" /LENGTH=37 /DNA_ID= /DNA_START= /DNA_END= /DNA_ORIENTATION=
MRQVESENAGTTKKDKTCKDERDARAKLGENKKKKKN